MLYHLFHEPQGLSVKYASKELGWRAAIFADAARDARLETVVVLSQWLVDATHLSIHARGKYLAGKIFEWAGDVGVITINPGWFADNYMAALEPISQFGLMALPLGEGECAAFQ